MNDDLTTCFTVFTARRENVTRRTGATRLFHGDESEFAFLHGDAGEVWAKTSIHTQVMSKVCG